MSDTVRMAELTWPDYDARVRGGRTPLLVPIGSTEQHGPHLPLNVDQLLPTAVAERVAGGVGGLVAPTFNYGYKSQPKAGGGNHMPGTTSLDAQTMFAQVKDVLRELARHGNRNVILVNGHYENEWFLTEGIDVALRELRWAGVADMKVMLLSYWDFIDEGTITRLYPDGFPGMALEHGGVMETSLMLALHPHLVDMSKAVDFPDPTFPPYDLFPLNPDWVPPAGNLSSALRATEDKGKEMLRVAVEGITAATREEFPIP
jgi:creatinine amidohydrolase